MKKYKRSPWGIVQYQEQIDSLMVSVSTASHGGVKVMPKFNKLIPQELRNQGGWYEEDCEYSIPFYFLYHWISKENREDREEYLKVLKNYFPFKLEACLNIDIKPGESAIKDEYIFKNENQNKWISFSNLCIINNVKSWLHKQSTKEEICVMISKDIYESHKTRYGCIFTDEQVMNFRKISGF